MQKNCIALFSKNTFLKKLLQQSHPEYSISHYKEFDATKAFNCSIAILDDMTYSENLLYIISNICTVIILENENKTYINLATHLSKPIKYSSICEAIDANQQEVIRISDNIMLNVKNKTLVKTRKNIVCLPVTETEIHLLKYILFHEDNTRDKILSEALGYNPEMETRTIETHISRLRKKLEPECSIELSENGKYKFLLKLVE